MEPEQPLHTEAALLPGYVNNTLSPEERGQVDRHLSSCSACQKELQEVKAMQNAVKSVIQQRPGPSPAAFAKVMNRIHQQEEGQTAPRELKIGGEPSFWEQLEQVFRSLFEVRWAPALASVLIVGQAVLLLSVLSGPQQQAGPQTGPVIERGIPQRTPATQTLNIEVQFVETAQESQIRGIIRDLGGRIIDGPTEDGRYTLGFPISPGLTSDSILTALKERTELVQRAQSLGS
jgi:anti-sigma factor RsiW